jgi:hypothetical protein
VIAGLGLYADRGVASDVGARIGPGLVPNVLCAALLGLGLVVTAERFFHPHVGLDAPAARVYAPAFVLIAAAIVILVGLDLLGIAISAGLGATIIAGYGLNARPIAFVWTVAASITVAFLLESSKLISKGVELWISWLG